jgi:hypothetical protein
MGVAEVIAFGALIVAIIAVWQSGEANKRASDANRVADEGNGYAKEAVTEARASNVLTQESNGIAHQAKDASQRATDIAQRALDESTRQWRHASAAEIRLQRAFRHVEDGIRAIGFTIENVGRAPASAMVFDARFSLDQKISETSGQRENGVTLAPGAAHTFFAFLPDGTPSRREIWMVATVHYRDYEPHEFHAVYRFANFDGDGMTTYFRSASVDGGPHPQNPPIPKNDFLPPPEWLRPYAPTESDNQ